jgi:surface protein
MFYNCTALTSLDLSGFNAVNVENMYGMFENCSSLKSLDLSGFNARNVEEMGYMFFWCKQLQFLDVSGIDANYLDDASNSFSGNDKLNVIYSMKNLKKEVWLPGNGEWSGTCLWYDQQGNTYTKFPQNLSEPIVLSRTGDFSHILTDQFIRRLYNVFLNRSASADEVSGWSEQILNGTITAGQAAAGFIFSPEFINRNMCNSHFLDYLYLGLFDRAADDDGKNGWTYLIDEGYSREMVVQGFLTSPEFMNLCDSYGVNCGTGLANVPALGTIQTDHCTIAGCPNDAPVKILVVGLYDTVFQRVPDQDEVDFWVDMMAQHRPDVTARVMVNSFLNGEEYSNLNRNNGDYIRDLYHAIFNRDADEGGFNDWLNRLENQGWTREQVLNGFTGSPEFIDQCHHAGIEIGGEI